MATLTETFESIAEAINAKGVSGSMTPSEMAGKIEDIPSGGGTNSGDAFVYPYVNGTLNGHARLYQAGKSLRSLQGISPASSYNNPPAYTVPTFQDINGNSLSTIGYGTKTYNTSQASSTGLGSLNNVSPFNRLTPYVSTELEQNFDATDYAIDSTTDFSVTTTTAQNVGNVTFTISYTPMTDITINSFKIYKTFLYFGKSDYTVLYMVIYLDEPLALTAGESTTIILKLSAYEET